jgi:hypothetical protein
MLKSRYHAVIWGKTPWGLLHAHLWRQKGKDVLVIDDQTLSTSSLGHQFLSMLEIGALEELIEKYSINALMPLKNFLRPARIKIQTHDFQWVSGGSATDQLRELVRKFAVFQTPELLAVVESGDIEGDLSRILRSYLEWFRSAQVRNRPSAPFVVTGVTWFAEFQKLLIQELTRPYQTPRDGQLSQLMTAHTAALGQVVKYNFTQHEATYLALRLISPLWELDVRWFEREMLRQLQFDGAHVKRAGIQSWQFGLGRVEAALLDSYEGVISYERLLMYGIPSSTAALQCVFQEKVYRGLESLWPHRDVIAFEDTPAELTCFTGAKLLGTDMPLALLEVDSTATRLQMLVEERPGAKPDFYRQDALSVARELVTDTRLIDADQWEALKPGHSWNVWVEEEKLVRAGNGARQLLERRVIDIVERERGSKILGVQYWGPLMDQRFGTLGYLTEVRWDMT